MGYVVVHLSKEDRDRMDRLITALESIAEDMDVMRREAVGSKYGFAVD